MKNYRTLSQARKSLVTQVTALFMMVLLIFTVARVKTGNRFNTTLPISFIAENLKSSDIVLEWKKDALPVIDYSVGIETDEKESVTLLYLGIQPDKAGEYELTVRDRTGIALANETFHVGRFMTVFAERTGNFTGDTGFFLATVVFYGGLSVLMLLFFLRLRGSQIYSYEAVFSLGVLFFSSVITIIELPAFIRRLSLPGMNMTWMLLDDIAAGGKYFAVLTFPLFLVFNILLIISNIALLRHEPPRFQNILGLILGFSMIGGILFFMTGGTRLFVRSGFYGLTLLILIENIIGVGFAYVECILLSCVVCGFRAAKHVPKPDLDFIVILGCGFRKDGTLPPLIKGRVDKALEFWHTQKEKTGKTAMIIPSGGQGKSEPMAEAEAMYRYIISTGFPDSNVTKEDQSVNTFQNMAFSKRLIEKLVPDSSKANVAFVTTNYHVFRSGIWANLAGLSAEGIGSRTKWWFWPNAFVRECVALLKNRLIPEILFLIGLVIVAGLFTWMSLL